MAKRPSVSPPPDDIPQSSSPVLVLKSQVAIDVSALVCCHLRINLLRSVSPVGLSNPALSLILLRLSIGFSFIVISASDEGVMCKRIKLHSPN